MKNICIIPARGGSKRLPRKNILPLGGISLLERVIQSVIKADVFDQIIVSSDDNEVLNIAEATGVVAYRRPVELGLDRSTVVEVCLDVLKIFPADAFCCVYATAALLSADTIKTSYEVFENSPEFDVLMGVSKYNYSPVQALQISDTGYAKMMFSEFKGVQSQFFPKMRVSNGSLYWARSASFFIEKSFYSEKLTTIDIPEGEVCDVDTLEDYQKLVIQFENKV